MELQFYVLFPNHENGMKLHKVLKAKGIASKIAPTPRALSTCCGISLLIQEQDVALVNACVKEEGIQILDIMPLEKDINPNRDKYC